MRKLLRRVWYVVTQRRRQADLSEEMAFHREMKERELLGAGRAADEAAVEARRALGSLALAKDDARDVWLPPWLQSISQDIRFAARVLSKDLRFSATVVLALALGLAVNATIFTMANTALLRPLPFDEADRLVSVGTRDSRGRNGGLSFRDFSDWRSTTPSIPDMAAYAGASVNLSDEQQAPERVRGGAFVSWNTFRLLRVQPAIGRDFVAEDDRPGATPVVMLGHGLWQRRYGGDRSAVGSTIRVNNVPSLVVGIMPERFGFPFSGDVWQPLALAPLLQNAPPDRPNLEVFGRLAEGTTIEHARAEIEAKAAHAAAGRASTDRGVTSRVEGMENWRVVSMKPIFTMMMAFVLFVLLIACANVANLLLARAAGRSREMAIRASLGATRWRIVRQLLVECGMLALVAGALGLVLSLYGVNYLGVAFSGREIGAPASAAVMPYWVDLSMDGLVFLFVGGLCVLTTLVSGLAPALHVVKSNPNDLLKEGGRGGGAALRTRRWTGGFMIAQIALTIILLTSAGLMLRTFVTLYRTDRVIETAGLVTARISLAGPRYAVADAKRRFIAQLIQRLSASPFLSAAALTSAIPFGGVFSPRRLAVEGKSFSQVDDLPEVGFVQAHLGYFDAVGVRMIRGRAFRAADADDGTRGVVIDQRLAQALFPGRDPLGQRIRIVESQGGQGPPDWRTIVGIAPAIPYNLGRPDDALPFVFAPFLGDAVPATLSILVRSRSDLAGTISLLREEVRALDPDLPVYYAQTIEDVFADARYSTELLGGWFGALAVLAIVLAAVGLFAITGHAVTQRTQEIGVRIALGARSREVVWLFLRRTLVQLGFGIVIGIAGALAMGNVLQNLIARTGARDPVTLVGVTVLLAVVALLATLLPARRATRIDPIVALRYE